MIRRMALALSLAGLGLLLFARNHAGWMEPLVDFGRELYVPWQLTQGKVLCRDIAYLDGPLSPYVNALWFSVLPVSIRTLEVANLAVVAAVSWLIFALLGRLGSALVGYCGVAVFLLVFAFNLIGTGGDMNWVTPYSHGVTHGVALALLGLWLLSRYQKSQGWRDLAGAGLAVGLSFLTKPEVSAAAALAIAVGFAATLAAQPRPVRRLARDVGVLAVSALLPFFFASGLLALAMPWRAALRGALGGWAHLLGTDVSGLHFYRWIMGIDDPTESLRTMGRFARLWATGLVPALAVALASRRPGRLRSALAVALPVLVLLAALVGGLAERWGDASRPLTPFVALFTVFAASAWWRGRSGPDADRASLQLAFAILALGLLLKILLKPVLWGYGFALALPAMLVVVLALLHSIPARVERFGGHGWTFRGASLVLLVLACLGCLQVSERLRIRKTVEIGSGLDRFRADPSRGASMVAGLVEWVQQNLPSDASLLVLPEGVIVNYLTRRAGPALHLNFLPPEIVIFGEDRILRDLEQRPPDFVALVHRDTREYGLPLFGTDYARDLMSWVRDHYEAVAQVGAAPLVRQRLGDHRLGFEVRKRRAHPPGTPARGQRGPG